MRHKAFSFQVKASDVSDDGTFEGYASVFGNKDLGGDIVVAGAFDVWLGEWRTSGMVIPILFNHSSSWVLGKFLEFRADDKGLWVKGQLNLDTVEGKEKRSLLKQGALSGLSIGYEIYPEGWRYEPAVDAFLLTSIKLWEVSLVTFPMNESARVSDVKSAIERGGTPSIRAIERALKELGFSQKQSKVIAKSASETLAAHVSETSLERRDGDLDASELQRLAAASKRLANQAKGMRECLPS